MYVFLADGFEEIEALAPIDVMRRAGLPVTTVSVTDSLTVTGAHGIPVVADAMFAQCDYADAALLFFPFRSLMVAVLIIMFTLLPFIITYNLIITII